MNQWMRRLMAAHVAMMVVAGAILLASTASFAQNIVGPLGPLGPGVGAYDPYSGYGRVWWQYRGGPKSTATTDLYYLPPDYVGPSFDPLGYDRYYRGEIVGPR